jgi:two-component system chemotaxis response regulator CheB
MRILVADDSALFRRALDEGLSGSVDIEEVVTVRDGRLAVLEIERDDSYSLLILDMEMPEMNGLEVIKYLRDKGCQIPILVFSTFSEKGAEITLEALNLGANDFAPKSPMEKKPKGLDYIKEEILFKVLQFKKKIKKKIKNKSEKVTKTKCSSERLKRVPQIICIGSSTGGPRAVQELLQFVSPSIPVPIILVQHMPPIFTKKFSESLSKVCKIEVLESFDGQIILPGKCYIAPGGYHMELKKENGKLVARMNMDERVCYVRPAVDVLFRSVTSIFGGNMLAVILTGMGEDGKESCLEVFNNGGEVLVQDRESSSVWGMPGAVHSVIPEVPIMEIPNIANYMQKTVA